MDKQITKEKIEKQNKPDKSYIKYVLLLLSYSGVLLILIGYGYTTGIALTFGYSATDLLHDTSGFLSAGFDPLLQITMKNISWAYIVNAFRSGLTDFMTKWYVIFFLIIYLIMYFFSFSAEKGESVKDWVLVNVVDRFKAQCESFKFIAGAVFFALLGLLLKLAATLLMYGAVLLVSAFFLMLPLEGYSLGEKYAKDYIKNPKECKPLEKGNTKEIEKKASCVRLLNGDVELVRGREIARNSERIFLYVKEMKIDAQQKGKEVWVPKSYPIRNVIIERVETEGK